MQEDYQEIITKVSKHVAKVFLQHEDNLAVRATLLDADIAELTRQIGVETTKIVIEQVRDELVKKNNGKDLSSKIVPSSVSTASSAQ